MAWNALADRILAGSKRKKELEVENQSEYDQWVSELDSEIEVFVKRVNDLDLEESSDRQQLYSLTDRFSDRFLELRERSEASAAPADALIKLEELIEQMNEKPSSPVSVRVSYIGDDPFRKARRKRKREERKKEQIERVRSMRDEIAEAIQRVADGFEIDSS